MSGQMRVLDPSPFVPVRKAKGMKSVTPFAVNSDMLKSKPSDSPDPNQLELWPMSKVIDTPAPTASKNSSRRVSLPSESEHHPMSEDKTNGQEAPRDGAVKYDAGKAPVFKGAIAYFPSAISGVSSVSAFGASKYAWNGWRGVDDGINRYTDAMVRHLVAESKGEVLDPDFLTLGTSHGMPSREPN